MSLLLSAAPAKASSPTPPKPPVLLGVTGSATPPVKTLDPGLEQNLSRVQTAAAARSALGAYYDSAESEYVVVAPASGPGSELTADDFADLGLPLRVEQSDYTQEQINAVTDDISQRDWDPAADQYSYASFFDIERGKTVLDSDAPPDVMASLLDQYPGAIDYEQHQIQRNSNNRYNSDELPLYGGAALVPNSDLIENKNAPMKCTSGFTVQAHTRDEFPGYDPAKSFMLTAGHCADVGQTLRNWTPQVGTNTVYGRVNDRASYPSYDMELLNTGVQPTYPFEGAFFVGENDADDILLVGRDRDAGDPVTSSQDYCTSGAQTFEYCDLKVYSDRAQLCQKGAACTSNLAAYRPADINAPLPAQPGDSGAPLYQRTDCEYQGSFFACAAIRGMHVAASGRFMFGVKWSTVAAGTPLGWDSITVYSLFDIDDQ
ncbi:MAG TPA: hypothetical protein VH912_03270 [Streptosporangiaceae bacterium]